jgi:hypothetical protein
MPRRGPETGVHRILAIPNPFCVCGDFLFELFISPLQI